jgi:hypothetical protein
LLHLEPSVADMSGVRPSFGLPHALGDSPGEGSSYSAPVRPDGSPSSLRDALADGWRELALYVAAGVAYVAIGVAAVEFLFTWIVAAGYLLVTVVLLPFAVGRIRARRAGG